MFLLLSMLKITPLKIVILYMKKRGNHQFYSFKAVKAKFNLLFEGVYIFGRLWSSYSLLWKMCKREKRWWKTCAIKNLMLQNHHFVNLCFTCVRPRTFHGKIKAFWKMSIKNVYSLLSYIIQMSKIIIFNFGSYSVSQFYFNRIHYKK